MGGDAPGETCADHEGCDDSTRQPGDNQNEEERIRLSDANEPTILTFCCLKVGESPVRLLGSPRLDRDSEGGLVIDVLGPVPGGVAFERTQGDNFDGWMYGIFDYATGKTTFVKRDRAFYINSCPLMNRTIPGTNFLLSTWVADYGSDTLKELAALSLNLSGGEPRPMTIDQDSFKALRIPSDPLFLR